MYIDSLDKVFMDWTTVWKGPTDRTGVTSLQYATHMFHKHLASNTTEKPSQWTDSDKK